jgi:hypothetical protein
MALFRFAIKELLPNGLGVFLGVLEHIFHLIVASLKLASSPFPPMILAYF